MQKISVSVRKGNLSDLEDIIMLNDELFKYEQKSFPSTPYKVGWSYTKESTLYYKKLLQEHICALGYFQNKLVGYIACEKITDNSRKNKTYAEIINVYVKENYRGYGIGTSLIKYIESYYSKLGIKNIVVTSLYLNSKALKFYQRLGYLPVEINSSKNLVPE